MADLSERGRRGQILLITAFVLAVIFVGLALVMNTVIYSENLATRADSTTSQPVLHANSMETGTADVISYINEHNTSESTGHSALKMEFKTAFGNLTDVAGRHALRDGQVTNDSTVSQFEGTWIKQTDHGRNFTSNDNFNSIWQLFSGANGARNFEIDVNSSSIANGPNAFKVTAQGSGVGGSWVMYVSTDEVNGTDSQGNDFSCTPGGGTNTVNVSNGSVNGNACPRLNFAADLDTIDQIDFENADNITGTYQLIANKSGISGSRFGTSPSDPFVEDALYGARIRIDFQRDSLTFTAERRVVPGESDD